MKLSTRKRILETAIKTFVDKGLDGARVDAIAKDANVNKAMIYYYFSSKDLLYYEVLKTLFVRVVVRLLSIISEDDSPLERLDKLIHAYYEYLVENRDFPKIILRELANGAPVLKKLHADVLGEKQQELKQLFMKILQDGHNNGTLRQVDPWHTMVSLMGMMAFPFIASPLIEKFSTADAESSFWQDRPDRVLDLFLHGVLRREMP